MVDSTLFSDLMPYADPEMQKKAVREAHKRERELIWRAKGAFGIPLNKRKKGLRSEACGIKIEGENKWKTLIQNASNQKR